VKRLTNVLQIVAVLLAAFFVACLFTSQFPPWKSDNSGGQAAANTTVVSAGTTAAGGAGTTAAGGGAVTTAGGGGATTAAASTPDGKALSEDNCATCHGKTGGGGFGPSLKGIQDRFSEEDEASIIRNGQGSMPGFGSDLSAEEIAAIVAYTRTLG